MGRLDLLEQGAFFYTAVPPQPTRAINRELMTVDLKLTSK